MAKDDGLSGLWGRSRKQNKLLEEIEGRSWGVPVNHLIQILPGGNRNGLARLPQGNMNALSPLVWVKRNSLAGPSREDGSISTDPVAPTWPRGARPGRRDMEARRREGKAPDLRMGGPKAIQVAQNYSINDWLYDEGVPDHVPPQGRLYDPTEEGFKAAMDKAAAVGIIILEHGVDFLFGRFVPEWPEIGTLDPEPFMKSQPWT